MKTTRARLSAALIAAVLGVLLIAGAALAASQTGLLARLFIDKPSDEAQRNVVEGGMSASDGGFTLNVGEMLRDGNRLYYSLDLTAPDEEQYAVMFNYPQVSIPGVAHASSYGGGMNMQMIGKGYEKYGAPLSLLDGLEFYEGIPKVDFTVTLHCVVFKPATEVNRDEQIGQVLASGEDYDGLWMKEGLRTAFGNEVNLCASPDFWNAMNERNCSNDFDACVALVEELGLAQRVADISLTMELNMDDFATSTGTVVDGQDTFEFDEYTLKVRVCDFNAVDAGVIVEIHPKRAMEEMTMENSDPLWYHYQVLNADGTPLKYLSGGGGGGTSLNEKGDVIYVYQLTLHGVNDKPESVILMPHRAVEGAPMAAVEDEAVTVKLAPVS